MFSVKSTEMLRRTLSGNETVAKLKGDSCMSSHNKVFDSVHVRSMSTMLVMILHALSQKIMIVLQF